MLNVDMLRSEIEQSGLKKKIIAEKLGLSAYGFQLKAEGKTEFTASEIKVLCEILGITQLTKMKAIFFA